MVDKVSAGLLMFREGPRGLEVFLVHPGGPYFRNKDAGAWTLPKGGVNPGETLVETAIREFKEETGLPVSGELVPLGDIRQKGGKTVHGWAFVGDWRPEVGIRSMKFTMEWPPRSGRMQSFPEVDRASFFAPDEARARINPAQVAFIDRLEAWLAARAAVATT